MKLKLKLHKIERDGGFKADQTYPRQAQRQHQSVQQERSVLEERLTAAQQNTSELKRHNTQLVERNSTAQRELTQERLARSQAELQLKNSQQVRKTVLLDARQLSFCLYNSFLFMIPVREICKAVLHAKSRTHSNTVYRRH